LLRESLEKFSEKWSIFAISSPWDSEGIIQTMKIRRNFPKKGQLLQKSVLGEVERNSEGFR